MKYPIKKAISKLKVYSGIALNKVFQGPYQVYVNPTDHCNLNCLMCATYSPLVKDKGKETKKATLTKENLNQLIYSLQKLKVSLVTITGGGEPFMYPHLMDFVRELKRIKKDVTIITNGTLIKKDQIQELLDLGVNLRFSLIAASPETYVEVHPNQTADTFKKLQNTLSYIRDIRKNTNSQSVFSILFVIFKNNYYEIPLMFNMGKECGADFVHFKPMIFDHNEMKQLFLNSDDFKNLKGIIQSFRNTHDIHSTDLKSIYNGLEINQNLLTNKGISTSRRSIPCYKGWTFAWIHANGNVVPCCDCNISLGNINDKAFEDIWYSKKYSGFRNKITMLDNGSVHLEGCRCDTCQPDSEEIKIFKVLQYIKR